MTANQAVSRHLQLNFVAVAVLRAIVRLSRMSVWHEDLVKSQIFNKIFTAPWKKVQGRHAWKGWYWGRDGEIDDSEYRDQRQKVRTRNLTGTLLVIAPLSAPGSGSSSHSEIWLWLETCTWWVRPCSIGEARGPVTGGLVRDSDG